MIEVILDDALEQTTDVADLTISLHALTGIHPRSDKTMQLVVVVNGIQLRALLDSGSTHNFIDLVAANRAVVLFQECAGLRIAVANGDRLTSPDMCQGLHLDVAGEVLRINYYSLALASFDMVLGVQWLESVGPILWDFSRRTMAFVQNGYLIC
jgi:hypothetical protein